MANRPSQHHSLNGDELRTIIEQRVKQGILQGMNLRAMYAYPLVRYKVTIEVVPYRPQGSQPPVEDLGKVERCIVDGQEYVAVVEDAVELVHDSPVIGWEKDPQQEREDSGLGRMETRRIEGQFIDTHVGKRIDIEEPELPPVRGRMAQPSPAPKPPAGSGGVAAQAKVLGGPGAAVGSVNVTEVSKEEAAKISRQEAEDWAQPQMDHEIQRAIANEEELPGRVVKVKK
jgi:hypothetical protein